MRGRRRLRCFGGMTLRAHTAASRLVARRPAGRGPRASWHPVALGWRQRRRRRPQGRSQRAMVGAPAVWAPQFHWHLINRVSSSAQPPVAGRPPFELAVHRVVRVFASTHSTSVRTVAFDATPRPRPVTQIWPVSRRPVPVGRTPVSLLGPPGGAQARAGSVAVQQGQARRPSIVGHTLYPARRRAASPAVARIERASPQRDHEFPLVRYRVVERERVSLPPSVNPHARPARSYRPPEITWRRTAPVETSVSATPPRRDRALSRDLAHAVTASAPAIAPVTVPSSGKAAPVQISDLDPRLVDRLTDDVIRRVERRVRIERERRGL